MFFGGMEIGEGKKLGCTALSLFCVI